MYSIVYIPSPRVLPSSRDCSTSIIGAITSFNARRNTLFWWKICIRFPVTSFFSLGNGLGSSLNCSKSSSNSLTFVTSSVIIITYGLLDCDWSLPISDFLVAWWISLFMSIASLALSDSAPASFGPKPNSCDVAAWTSGTFVGVCVSNVGYFTDKPITLPVPVDTALNADTALNVLAGAKSNLSVKPGCNRSASLYCLATGIPCLMSCIPCHWRYRCRSRCCSDKRPSMGLNFSVPYTGAGSSWKGPIVLATLNIAVFIPMFAKVSQCRFFPSISSKLGRIMIFW